MVRASPLLARYEDRYAREACRGVSYHDALELYAALWAEARQLNPALGEDWREDVAAALAVARAANGLPPLR